MELQLFGINHKTSDVSEREKFIINESNQILLDSHLKKVFNNARAEKVTFYNSILEEDCTQTIYIAKK